MRGRRDPISRRFAPYIVAVAILAAIAVAAWWFGRSPDTPPPPQHVLLITIDTLRADALGSYGRTVAHTPWMDRLAAAGVRFTHARAHNVVTLPSHANILSGRYPFEHGVRDNAGFRFPATLPTLATILRSHGYRTGAFVSAFPLDARFGLARGFDVYDDAFVGSGTPEPFLVQERSAAETIERARAWLEAQGHAPTLCWVHLYEPHFPYAPPEPLARRFRQRPYDGEVAAVDAALGPLLEPILEAGENDDTLVVLTSDHGESLGEHGEATHGIFGYEATLRVPLVVYEPRRVRPAVVSSAVRHVDILPTILEALAIPRPTDLSGHSLISVAQGRAIPAAPTYFEAMSGLLNRGWAPLRGIVIDERKLIELPETELYDLARDPVEARNLAPRGADDLRAALARLTARDRGIDRRAEDADTRARLRSLGYADGGAPRVAGTDAARDDPKHLIALDAVLQDIAGRYLDGDLAAALALCRDLVRRRPDMPVAWLYLAHLERESGQVVAGIDALHKAIAINPHDTNTLALLGAYLTEAGRARDAVERLAPVAQSDQPDINLVVPYSLALARIGRIDDALSALTHAQQTAPSNAMLHVHEGTIHLMANDRARARAAFEAALSLSPDVARAHSSLGVLAAEEGDSGHAVEHWSRAVALDPREYRTVVGVGLTLARQGRASDARPYLEFFARGAPPSLFSRELKMVAGLMAGPRTDPGGVR